MKQALYDITDPEFITLLDRTNKAFTEAKIPFMFVGGVAVQAHTAKYLCNSGKTIKDLVADPDFRVQDYFRATDDVDMTLQRPQPEDKSESSRIEFDKRILTILQEIEGKEPKRFFGEFFSPDEQIVAIKLNRLGAQRPKFDLGLNEDPSSDKAASFNLYKGPEDSKQKWGKDVEEFENRFYHYFMNRGEEIKLPFCENGFVNLRVKRVEDLLATKIIRGRPKDIQDALSLAAHAEGAGMTPSYDDIWKLLSGQDEKYKIQNQSFIESYGYFDTMLNRNLKRNQDKP